MSQEPPHVRYSNNGQLLNLRAIYRRITKRRGRAKILADAKLVFVRDKRKTDWLAILSTDTSLADEEIVRIYGKRWDIEVFFKMAKQHLKLAKKFNAVISMP